MFCVFHQLPRSTSLRRDEAWSQSRQSYVGDQGGCSDRPRPACWTTLAVPEASQLDKRILKAGADLLRTL